MKIFGFDFTDVMAKTKNTGDIQVSIQLIPDSGSGS